MSQEKLKLVCDRFPDHSDVIHRLARENSNFNELVQDFAVVNEMLVKWRISKKLFAESRIKEYRMLQKELESEIEQFVLDAVKSTAP